MVLEENADGVRIITLNHPNKHNPFSRSLENSVKDALARANADDGVHAVVVYGGAERSFSVGGDFNEVKQLSRSEDIEEWIDRVIDLYQAVLNVNKPTLAAVDGYAIGMGFQFALMFDQRLMASTACFSMPELKHGIGCSVGAAILGFTHGFNTMQEIIYQCQSLDAARCMDYHLVNQMVDSTALLDAAITQAHVMAGYPVSAFINTKRAVNKPFIHLLEQTRDASKSVHKAAFQARDAQGHFKNVLGKKY
ncbi:carboxymethylproline synthase [Brenneria corticis]|uniref:Enoyl-CoA hydratase/isomerase family protein n=1 Tax=Brenneria corticis TaxID=2173106 RepID=A0A2U1TJ44_9GAMM|nr:carboxymethylproline synthase [Brenneria sp. CFCC 11842]PWC09434.1 enoyl-CoA hydratase/isomerase family protein [Brenneria sp. CFCC 11842]